jgi:hypothetical protein
MAHHHQLYRANSQIIGWLIARTVADATHGPFAGRELLVLQTLPEGPNALHVVLADDARLISVEEVVLDFSERLQELLDEAMFKGAGKLALWVVCANEIDGAMHCNPRLPAHPQSYPGSEPL